jgi:hypothetical protein
MRLKLDLLIVEAGDEKSFASASGAILGLG